MQQLKTKKTSTVQEKTKKQKKQTLETKTKSKTKTPLYSHFVTTYSLYPLLGLYINLLLPLLRASRNIPPRRPARNFLRGDLDRCSEVHSMTQSWCAICRDRRHLAVSLVGGGLDDTCVDQTDVRPVIQNQ